MGLMNSISDIYILGGEEFVGFFGESSFEERIDHKRISRNFLANAGSLILRHHTLPMKARTHPTRLN